jgi:serpin B
MSDSAEKAMADLSLFEAQADFAIDLLRESALASNASLILSPISIALALSLAYAGSLGDTRKQFDSKFAKGKSNAELDDFFFETLKTIGAPKNVTLETVNRAYAEKTLSILDSYRKIVIDHYGGDFEQVDFKQNSSEAVERINKFVSQKTHDKINNLLSKDAVTKDTRLILINAIYFKGDWGKKFDKAKTVDQKFFVSENSEKQVKMMKMKHKTGYFETDEVQVLELPYVDDSIKFVAFLPKEKFGLNKFIQSLNGSKLLQLKSKLRQEEVNIELPRFKIESEFSLKPTLSKLGLEKGFDRDAADFSGITKEDKLHISDVIHKGFVEVTEAGSEASGGTAVKMNQLGAAPMRRPKEFKADHAYLFAIFDKELPLFFGLYNSE